MDEQKITADQLKVLVLGLDPLAKSAVESLFTQKQILELPYDLEKFMETQLDPPPAMIFIGPAPEGVNLIEVAQISRMQYQASSIYYVTQIRTALAAAPSNAGGPRTGKWCEKRTNIDGVNNSKIMKCCTAA
ncbi:MAG: hypothetical protein EOP09_05225 [Proteobacteria bacterium]|nr:MAG: hypothetical protein EOP09_05225 [Pseudomonadota bacterium]